MSTLTRFLKSSILSKVVMAATGLVLVLFLFGHMSGNLQMFMGQERMNKYAETLQNMGALLWVIRGTLVLCAFLHVWTSIRLKLLNMAARPVSYAKKDWVKATISSRTMLLSGSLIAAFLAYHLMHLTLGTTNPDHSSLTDYFGRHDVYSMVILGYQNLPISAVYIVGMVLLFFHLNHAIASMFQTLGINHPKYNGIIEKGSILISFIIVLGFISIPVGVLSGIITLPEGVM